MSPIELSEMSRDKYFKLRVPDNAAANYFADGSPNLLSKRNNLSLDSFFRLEIATNNALELSSVISLNLKFNSSSSRLIRLCSYLEISK